MENLTSPFDLDAARNELAAAGYRGERVVLLMPTDVPRFMSLAEVTADLLQKLGMNVDLRLMDMATVVQRRVKPGTGGPGRMEHLLHHLPRVDQFNPAVNAICAAMAATATSAGRPARGSRSCATQWFAASDLTAQKKAAEQLQLQAFQDVPYIPLGQWRQPTAHRTDLQGMLTGLPLFWNTNASDYVACRVVIHYLIVSAYY